MNKFVGLFLLLLMVVSGSVAIFAFFGVTDLKVVADNPSVYFFGVFLGVMIKYMVDFMVDEKE